VIAPAGPLLIGIDDTDVVGSPGTNQLGRRLAARLPFGFRCRLLLRHQLFFDPRIPYTSQNGSASLLVEREPGLHWSELLPALQREMRAWYVPGSDPGLCVAEQASGEITAFAHRCTTEVVRQAEARELAAAHGIHLEGLGGTEDGVIGALAAVGLLASGDHGRVVHLAGWTWPDPFAGVQPVSAIRARGVEEIVDGERGNAVEVASVDIGKHLRPSYRGRRVVLFVERAPDTRGWRALKRD
jgi:hypothetical protein